MILTLQEEKVMEKLEACQYKRLAEAKMHYAAESQSILEEAILQKEIEIASLKYQVQAYRHRLRRISVNNPDTEEMKIYDCSVHKRSNSFVDEKSFLDFARRNMSLPAASIAQLCSERDISEDESYLLRRGQSIHKNADECTIQLNGESEESQNENLAKEHVIEECSSLNVQQKVISESFTANSKLQKTVSEVLVSLGGKCGSYSEMNHSGMYHSTTGDVGVRLKDVGTDYMYSQVQDSTNAPESNADGSSHHNSELNGKASDSISVQDTEVMKSHSCCLHSQSGKLMLHESTLEGKNAFQMLHSVSQESLDNFLTGNDLDGTLMHTQKGKKLLSSSAEASWNYHSTAVDPEITVVRSQTDVEQLKGRMKQLENETRTMSQYYSNEVKEQLKLLREMHDQLNKIQSDLRNSNSHKSLPQD